MNRVAALWSLRRGQSQGDTDIETRKKALRIAAHALDKKAFDLVVLDVRNLASYADYVVICSGNSDRQLAGLAQSIEKHIGRPADGEPEAEKCRGIEGSDSGRWVLLDYGDVVVHIFYDPIRPMYDIEGMWSEAPAVQIPGYDRKRDMGYAQFA